MAPWFDEVLAQVPVERWVTADEVVLPAGVDTPTEQVLRRLNREGFLLRRMVGGVARWTRTPTGDRALSSST